MLSLLFGAWAVIAPQSIFEVVAEFERYNRHLIHDLGTMQLSIGSGAAAGAWFDIPGLTVLAAVGVAALVGSLRGNDRDESPNA